MLKSLRIIFMFFETVKYLKVRQIQGQIIKRFRGYAKPRLDHSSVDFITFAKISIKKKDYIRIINGDLFIFGIKYLNGFAEREYSDYLVEFSFHYCDWVNYYQNTKVAEVKLDKYLTSELFDEAKRWHPYACSKRLVNLLIFVNNSVSDRLRLKLNTEIATLARHVLQHIEYETDGNHVLTNYHALSVYFLFTGDKCYKKFYHLYFDEFERQFKHILHYERSYAYTLQLLEEFSLVVRLSSALVAKELIQKYGNIFGLIRDLDSIFMNCHFGDNIYEQSLRYSDVIAPLRLIDAYKADDSHEHRGTILGYAYRRIGLFDLILDAGSPHPSHQPGHAHDSTLGIELCYDHVPLFISSAVSTYEKCRVRDLERSRHSYSKVISEGHCQEVWSSFRIAKRVKPTFEQDEVNKITVKAKFVKSNVFRSIYLRKQALVITDNRVLTKKSKSKSKSNKFKARYFISNHWVIKKINESELILKHKSIKLKIASSSETVLSLNKYTIATRYGLRESVNCLVLESNNDEMRLSVITC